MLELDVEKMTCGHCASRVTRAVREVAPEAEVRIDLARRRVCVMGAPSEAEVIRALDEAGYPAAAR